MSDEEPERPEFDLEGNRVPWEVVERFALAGMRTEVARRWRVACDCENPDPHWVVEPSPVGPEYDRWLLHYHHGSDCPTNKILNAFYN
jgi:hypothetical protein